MGFRKPRYVQLDESGCYIILWGCLNQLPITLIGIYAPNDQQANFGAELLNRVNTDTPYVMIWEDFNAVCATALDRSRHIKSWV